MTYTVNEDNEVWCEDTKTLWATYNSRVEACRIAWRLNRTEEVNIF